MRSPPEGVRESLEAAADPEKLRDHLHAAIDSDAL
jgi:hypothetical protein